MAVPQPGIFAQGTRAHHHLQFDLRPGVDDQAIRDAFRPVREPARAAGGANLVIGIGADLWRRLAPTAAPADLAPMQPVDGVDGHRVPATQHDVWVWLHGTGPDVLIDMAGAVTAALAPVADLVAERACFVYHDSRDLTGFVDGTANPPIEEAAEVALVPDGAPGAGGSHAIVMTWMHDLASFHQLPVEEQEGVIGRTKPDSIELDDAVRPPTSHVSRVEIEDADGEEIPIFRRSVPWGVVGECGLEFVAFSADPGRYRSMLDRMYGRAGDGVHDRLIEFTTAVEASLYFVPSLDDWQVVTA